MKKVTLAAAALMIAASSQASHAGGLFGNGGLIRGSIGGFFDKHLEKPILTPLAQGATVSLTTIGGGILGTFVGTPQLGAILGAAVGDEINDAAAGK